METFTNKDELNEEMNQKEKGDKTIKNNKLFLLTLILIFSIIIIISYLTIIIIINSKDNKNEKNKQGEIICYYKIDNSSNQIQLLSDFFELKNNPILNTYINGTEVNIAKKYLFETEGLYQINYILKDGINMDYMFKDIESLEKVEIISKSYNKISSMEGTFENCRNLIDVSIEGFNTEQIKSTSKLFYNTGIQNLKLNNFKTNNLEDMSYMFSNTKLLELNLDLIGFNTNKVKNMSGMFKNSFKLKSLYISKLNTENVIDMSEMFTNCE